MIATLFLAAPALVVRECSAQWRCWRALLVLEVMVAATMDVLFNDAIVIHGSHHSAQDHSAHDSNNNCSCCYAVGTVWSLQP